MKVPKLEEILAYPHSEGDVVGKEYENEFEARFIDIDGALTDLQAVGIYHEEEPVWGILREKTGDEEEFTDLDEGGAVISHYRVESYEDFVDKYMRLDDSVEDLISPFEQELQGHYAARGSYGRD